MGWTFLAITTVVAPSCGNGRTALATINRDAQGDVVDRPDGTPSRVDQRTPGEGGNPGGSGGRGNGGSGGAGGKGDGGAGGGSGYGGAAGAGDAGVGGVGRGGVAGRATGGTAGVARGGTSGQSGRGGGMGGGAGTNSVAGNSGRGGVALADAAVATGGVAGATRDGGMSDLRDGAADSNVDGPVRWRNSANDLCVPTSVDDGSASVYSDGSNLFVMAWTAPASAKPAGGSPATIWANDGSGWRTYFTWSKDAQFPTRYFAGNRAGLRGRADGSLFAFGRYGCAIELVDELGAHCSGALPSVADLFVSGGNTAYATDGYYLLKLDGSVWTQVAGRFPLGDAAMVQGYALWADKSTVVVGGDNGYVLVMEDEKVVTMLPKPEGAHNITGVWAWSANDLWAATEGGDLFRYDGSQWTLKWTPPAYAGGGARLWGAAGHLFVIGWGTFAEWDGTGLRSLLPSDQADWQFTDVWGNSPTEVFATSVATSDTQIGSCNAVRLWWYDGTTARTM